MRPESGRTSGRFVRARRPASAFARAVRWVAVLVPVLLAAEAAHSASMLTNFGPRVQPNIGPRAPSLNTTGPRLDPSFHGVPGNNAGNDQGGNNPGGNNAGSRTTKTQTRRNNDNGNNNNANNNGVPPPGERRYIPDEAGVEFTGNQTDQQITALFSRFRLTVLETRRIAR